MHINENYAPESWTLRKCEVSLLFPLLPCIPFSLIAFFVSRFLKVDVPAQKDKRSLVLIPRLDMLVIGMILVCVLVCGEVVLEEMQQQ